MMLLKRGLPSMLSPEFSSTDSAAARAVDETVGKQDFVLAIDFGGTKVALACADLQGHVLGRERLDTNADKGALQVVERTVTYAQQLIQRTVDETGGGCCVAVGAVSPGVILPDRILLAPNVPGWEKLALRDVLFNGLGIPLVLVGNDAKAAAIAEWRWGSLRNADPAIYLTLGTGVASALLIGGRVLMGAHGAAGEIGYNLRSVTDQLGAAHGRAPLEEAVGGRAIGERGSQMLGTRLSAGELFAHSDARAHALIDDALSELAVHVANLAITIDPARIAVGGGMMNWGSALLDALSHRLRLAVPFPPELVAAHFLHDASLYGAVALALEAYEHQL